MTNRQKAMEYTLHFKNLFSGNMKQVGVFEVHHNDPLTKHCVSDCKQKIVNSAISAVKVYG